MTRLVGSSPMVKLAKTFRSSENKSSRPSSDVCEEPRMQFGDNAYQKFAEGEGGGRENVATLACRVGFRRSGRAGSYCRMFSS